MRFTPQEIAARITSYQVQQQTRFAELFSSGDMRRLRAAAVIIPLLTVHECWYVLLTHRSQNLPEHRGQVAYPGGAREFQDRALEDTALREMYEEIGVYPKDVRVFGSLGDMPVITGYLVRLFVGLITWPYALKLNPEEVDSAFIVPLNWLANPAHRSIQYRSYAGREFPVIFFDTYEGHQLWGASAEMTLVLLSALGLPEEGGIE